MSAKPAPSSASRIAPTRPSIMSEGATTSAPGARVRDRHLREQLEGRVVLDLAALDDAAVAVARCTRTGRRRSSTSSSRHAARMAAHGLLHDAVVGVALAARRGSLASGRPKRITPADAEGLDLARLAGRLVDREVEAAGQRRDLAPHARRPGPRRGDRRAARGRARVSRTMARRRSVRRSRRGRSSGKPIGMRRRLLLVVVAEEELVGAALGAEEAADSRERRSSSQTHLKQMGHLLSAALLVAGFWQVTHSMARMRREYSTRPREPASGFRSTPRVRSGSRRSDRGRPGSPVAV